MFTLLAINVKHTSSSCYKISGVNDKGNIRLCTVSVYVQCVQGFGRSSSKSGSSGTSGRGIATISKSLQQQQQQQRKPQSTLASRREQLLAIGSDKRKTASPTSSNNNSDDSDEGSVDHSFDFDFNASYAEITDDATTSTTANRSTAVSKAVQQKPAVQNKPKTTVYDVLQAELQASAAALKAAAAAADRQTATAAATATSSSVKHTVSSSSSGVSSDALTVHKRAQQQQQQRKRLSPEALLANSILKKQLHTAVRDATEPTVRLKSLNRFHRIVLSCWTDAQLMLSTAAAAAASDDASTKHERALVPLAATRYSSTADYVSVFQGLLLEEVRACIAESNDTNSNSGSNSSVKLRVERVEDDQSDSKFTYVTLRGISTQSSSHANRSSYGDNSTRSQYARDRGQEYDNVPANSSNSSGNSSSALDALLHHDVVLLTSSDSAGSSSMRLSQQQQQHQQYRLAIVERDQDALHGAKRYENANKIRLKLFLASGNSDCDDTSSSGSGGIVIDDDAVVTISKKSKVRTDTSDNTAGIGSGEQQIEGNSSVFIQGQTWTAKRLDSITTSGACSHTDIYYYYMSYYCAYCAVVE
jgi:hypothetical protein